MIGSTPLPGGGGSDVDLGPVEQRLDTLELNRSVGEPVVAEIVSHRSGINAATLFLDVEVWGLDVQFSDGFSTIYISAYEDAPVIETFETAFVGSQMTVSVDGDGRLIVRSGTGRLTITTADAWTFEALFPAPDVGYGNAIIARDGIEFDTDAEHVRIRPDADIASGSGESLLTALRALHAADTEFAAPVRPVFRIRVPDGSDPFWITVDELGLTGKTIQLVVYCNGVYSSTQMLELASGSDSFAIIISNNLMFDDGGYTSVNFEEDGLGVFIALGYGGLNPLLNGDGSYIVVDGTAATGLTGSTNTIGSQTIYSADQIRMVGAQSTVQNTIQRLIAEIGSLRDRVTQLESSQ